MRLGKRCATLAFASVALLCFGSANAQQAVQTGDGLLKVQANMPEEVRAGEQFSYKIQVTNSSDNVVLHDIKLKQSKAKGLTIENVSVQTGKKQGGQQQDKKKQQQGNKKKQNQKQGSGGQSGGDQMQIAKLMPGESATIQVKAASDQEGKLRSCLEIVNYTPAICLTSQTVKPELQITKNAPKKADRCNVIEIEYAVKNAGSGDLGKFQVQDQLGQGLETIEGESTLKFDVETLAAGETREFLARVYATKPGTYSSRAVAKAENSDLKARSKKTSTEVVAADLAVQVDGPNRLYGDQLATFNAQVTNNGNTNAEDVRVKVSYPQNGNLVDMSDPQMQQSKQNQGGNSQGSNQSQGNSQNQGNNQNQPTVAQKSGSGGDSQQQGGNQKKQGNKQKSGGSDMQMESQSFTIGNLKPGQTAQFEYAIRPGDLQEIPTKVEARYICTVDAADAETKVTAQGMKTAKIIRLPAMQLMVVDDEDPVKNQSKVTYQIRVWNEGQAPDQDVEITAMIPDGLEFASADGPTDHSVSGSTVKFKPIDKFEAGDRADYTVTATSKGTGSVRFESTLQSQNLKKEVTAEEPTELFAGQASN